MKNHIYFAALHIAVIAIIALLLTGYINEIRIQINPSRDIKVSQEFFEKIILGLKNKSVRTEWTYSNLVQVSRHIDSIARSYSIRPELIYSMIYNESEFNRYARSRRNRDGSYDFGMTQQNSYYVQGRCILLMQRNCSESELYDPVISVLLMEYRFKECIRHRGDEIIKCYNPNAPDYLEKILKIEKALIAKYGTI